MKENKYFDSNRDKMLNNLANNALHGKYKNKFRRREVEGNYSFEKYSETLPDGKVKYVSRRIRNTPSQYQTKYPTIIESVSIVDPSENKFAFKTLTLENRLTQAFQHIINNVLDDSLAKTDKIVKIKQLNHHAKHHKQFYQIIASYIIENQLQEDIKKVFDFMLENREEILSNKYFSHDDYQSVLNVMDTISALVDDSSEK